MNRDRDPVFGVSRLPDSRRRMPLDRCARRKGWGVSRLQGTPPCVPHKPINEVFKIMKSKDSMRTCGSVRSSLAALAGLVTARSEAAATMKLRSSERGDGREVCLLNRQCQTVRELG